MPKKLPCSLGVLFFLGAIPEEVIVEIVYASGEIEIWVSIVVATPKVNKQDNKRVSRMEGTTRAWTSLKFGGDKGNRSVFG